VAGRSFGGQTADALLGLRVLDPVSKQEEDLWAHLRHALGIEDAGWTASQEHPDSLGRLASKT